MTLKRISDTGAFSAGADVWLIGSPRAGQWSARVDWYLNFLFERALMHRPQSLSQGFLDLLRELELAPPDQPKNEASVILGTGHDRLPCKRVVCVPNSTMEQWLQALSQVSTSFGAGTVRVFLSPDLPLSDFETACRAVELNESLQLEVVADQALASMARS